MKYLGDQNYYEILEVSEDAPQNEIRRTYDRMKATYSQDSAALYTVFSKEEARELMRLIEEAYTVLGNHNLRKTYDEKMKSLRAEHGDNYQYFQPAPVVSAQAGNLSSAQKVSGDNFQDSQNSDSEKSMPQAAFSGRVQPIEISIPLDGSQNEDSKIMGRTVLSTYKIDEEFENAIKEQEIFDGAFLKKVREYKNLTLEQISEHTRVGKDYLGAIESQNYAALPAAVFVRGFVVQFAKILNLDHNKVAASFMSIFKAGARNL